MMRSVWLKLILVLAGVWLIAGGVIWWARAAKPTPEKIANYLAAHPVDGLAGAKREKVIHKVADQINALEYEQRRELRMGRRLDAFFRSLTPEEQTRFLDLTLPTGFKQMMEAFNKMEPQKRKRFVERALNDMKQQEGAEPPPGSDDPHVKKIVEQGVRSFYSDASADVKMDFAPLLEQMQKNVQGLR
jgi:hypothetical protein